FGIRSTAIGGGTGSLDALSQALTRTGDHSDWSGVAGCGASTRSAAKRSKSWRVNVAVPIWNESQTARPAQPTAQLTPSANVISRRRTIVTTVNHKSLFRAVRGQGRRTAGFIEFFCEYDRAVTIRRLRWSNPLESVPKCR